MNTRSAVSSSPPNVIHTHTHFSLPNVRRNSVYKPLVYENCVTTNTLHSCQEQRVPIMLATEIPFGNSYFYVFVLHQECAQCVYMKTATHPITVTSTISTSYISILGHAVAQLVEALRYKAGRSWV